MKGSKKARKYLTILSVKVDSTEQARVLRGISNSIIKKEKIFVVTPNPEIIMLAAHDTVLSSILNSADISLPDGVGLVWASRWLALKAGPANSQIAHRVSGVDVMEELVKLAGKFGWRVFLLGGKPSVAVDTAHKLKISNLKLKIETDSGPWLDDNGKPINKEEEKKEKEVIKKINDFRPHLLFVGFGVPKQEKWAALHMRNLEVNCVMVVGGAFDYISGKIPRAPLWIRNLGFEWFFRLIFEPWRIKRQFALLRFVLAVLRS